MALQHIGMDEIDVQILATLQKQGRTKRNELAEEVHLSIPAISERLRKLEERGILKGFHAELEPKLVGLDVAAFIFVTVDSSSHYGEFLRSAQEHPEVLEIHAVTGDGSHVLKIRTWNTSTLERLLSQIQTWPGVKATRTNVVLSTNKETLSLPIEELTQKETE
ncbi:MAG: Lrp/AsnC family transcriptional regulator [Candidatus Kapaibacterium sp.]|jgi:Lrp/AsnC family leucine-responsive transcriptional regulator